MTWLTDLYKVYQDNESSVNQPGIDQFDNPLVLLPESHMYQNCQVEIKLLPDGTFESARVLPKGRGNTVIPCTVKSANRTRAMNAHPLHDKLQYVAGDFIEFGGDQKTEPDSYNNYLKLLSEWCNSEYSVKKIEAILTYVNQGHLIRDLVENSILVVDQNNHLIPKWNKEIEEAYVKNNQIELREKQSYKPEIFESLSSASDQFSTFVRFDVHIPNEPNVPTWEDQAVISSFISFYRNHIDTFGVDYITGKSVPLTGKHPAKIRYGGDQAKLISGNDKSGYTFRGRFQTPDQVVTIGFDVSDKGHKALKWLIAKQGLTVNGRVFLAWGDKDPNIPKISDSTYDLLAMQNLDSADEIEDTISNTKQLFAKQFDQAILGYGSQKSLDTNSQIHIMVLDSAILGRMDIVYYQSLDKDIYLKRLKQWHLSCFWRQKHGKTAYWGAPSSRDISERAFGSHANDEMINRGITRLIPCITEGASIPVDIRRQLLVRACSPLTMDYWEWEQTLSIACSVFNHQYRNEGFSVSLDENNHDRSYLFGRMLAIADSIESQALRMDENTRTTNAMRYMTTYSQRPETTWKIIQQSIIPYSAKLKSGSQIFYQRKIDSIGNLFQLEDFNDKPLSGKFLLGLYSQRYDLSNNQDSKGENKND